MNIVDSSGWLEFFADSVNAESFAEPLTNRKKLIVPTIILYEVFKIVLRERCEGAALQTVALMRQGNVIDLDETISLKAARLSLMFKLPMADSIILSVAQLNKAVIWTQDEHFKGLDGVLFFEKKF